MKKTSRLIEDKESNTSIPNVLWFANSPAKKTLETFCKNLTSGLHNHSGSCGNHSCHHPRDQQNGPATSHQAIRGGSKGVTGLKANTYNLIQSRLDQNSWNYILTSNINVYISIYIYILSRSSSTILFFVWEDNSHKVCRRILEHALHSHERRPIQWASGCGDAEHSYPPNEWSKTGLSNAHGVYIYINILCIYIYTYINILYIYYIHIYIIYIYIYIYYISSVVIRCARDLIYLM